MSKCQWSTTVFILSAGLWAFSACGSSDDTGVSVVDSGAGSAADSGVGGGVSAQNLGRACSQTNLCPGQNEICLVADAAGDGFCSIQCAGPGDPSCGNGYPGPGGAACIYGLLDDQGNDTGISACGIVCDAPDEVCPATLCAGTCPAALQCVASTDPQFRVCELGGAPGIDAGASALQVAPQSPQPGNWPLARAYRLP